MSFDVERLSKKERLKINKRLKKVTDIYLSTCNRPVKVIPIGTRINLRTIISSTFSIRGKHSTGNRYFVECVCGTIQIQTVTNINRRNGCGRNGSYIREDGTKRCSRCKDFKEIKNFSNIKSGKFGLRTSCKSCDRKIRLKCTYGIEWEDYLNLLNSQNDCCSICKNVLTGDNKDTYVDHSHKQPYKIRALLCPFCNWGLGHFRDNPDFLLSAIQYLYKHEEPQDYCI